MEYTSSSIQQQCVKGSFALLIYLGIILTFAFVVFTPHEAKDNEDYMVVEFEGTIGRYPIQMSLNLTDIENNDDCEVTGKYRYTESGEGGILQLYGEKTGSHLYLKEYDDDGHQTGTFDGTFETYDNLSSFEYTGTFVTSKGKSYQFAIKSN